MGRSSTGRYRARAYKDRHGQTRYRAVVPIGYYPSGKPKSKTVTATTYRACQAKLNSLLKEIQQHGAPTDSRIRLGEYASKWLDQRHHEVDPKTYAEYQTVITRHLKDYAYLQLSSIVPSTIHDILNNANAYTQKGEIKGPAGVSLKKQIRTCLNQIMQSAVADRLIPSNPVIAVKPPTNKDAVDKRGAFSVPEIKAMLDAASHMGVTEGAIWWWRLLTGMRQGEILGATWADYNRRTNIYTVSWKLQTVPRDHGCGDPIDGEYPCGKHKGGLCPQARWRIPDGYDMRHLSGSYALTRPKSQTGRGVPIVPPLQEVMSRYRKATATRPNPYDLIFCHLDGSCISSKEDMAAFRSLMRLAGINPAEHTGHETRHSVVTLLASQGVDFQLIREIVGHSSDAMVEHYRHADDAERLKAMETLDESLGLEQIGWSGE